MEAGNAVAAIAILKAAALDKLPPPAGPTDPGQMFAALVEARVKEKRAKHDRTQSAEDMLDSMNAGYLSRLEAEHTAAAKAEIEAELEAKLNGDGV
jgi:hypothetical protein